MSESREQHAIRNRAYYLANRERLVAAQRARYDATREIRVQHARVYRATHPEDPLKRMVWNANRTAIRYGVLGRITRRDVEYLPTACVYCGSTESLTVDHATPLCRGGENHWSNLTTACFDCNRRKWDKTVAEFAEVRLVA